ncbi:MAG: lytic transglycosylase domain-containing protein [Betaproteobacteria bacterium]|nr:lytic transglycosylase domain-containing protein [Betaproteobacteria bacterium]NBY05289.1 lytic transglycosylase domain-containing protein [Betaproteobacteria bacterium]
MTLLEDIGHGFFLISHNGFALVGVSVVLLCALLILRPELRSSSEALLMSWLQERQSDSLGFATDIDAADRATANDPRELPKQQANLAYWLSRKYRVAPEPLSALVAEAYEVGPSNQIEPTLILAVMAIESGFNPFAQSAMGAQGLMQVMTRVHSEKYEGFGGKFAAFDPVANLRVGVYVLKECIARAGGSVEGGLKFYVGASNNEADGGYAQKVLAEHARLLLVASGQSVPASEPSEAPATAFEKLWDRVQKLGLLR